MKATAVMSPIEVGRGFYVMWHKVEYSGRGDAHDLILWSLWSPVHDEIIRRMDPRYRLADTIRGERDKYIVLKRIKDAE